MWRLYSSSSYPASLCWLILAQRFAPLLIASTVSKGLSISSTSISHLSIILFRRFVVTWVLIKKHLNGSNLPSKENVECSSTPLIRADVKCLHFLWGRCWCQPLISWLGRTPWGRQVRIATLLWLKVSVAFYGHTQGLKVQINLAWWRVWF